MTADHVDKILNQWKSARPDLDCSPMGISGRIGRASRLLLEEMETVHKAYDLSLIEMDIIATLRRSQEPLTPTQLYKTLMYSSGIMSTRIEGLVKRGLIERQYNEVDRRSCQVLLTREGEDLTDQLMTQHVNNLHRLTGGLTNAEQEKLATLLHKLLLSLGDNE